MSQWVGWSSVRDTTSQQVLSPRTNKGQPNRRREIDLRLSMPAHVCLHDVPGNNPNDINAVTGFQARLGRQLNSRLRPCRARDLKDFHARPSRDRLLAALWAYCSTRLFREPYNGDTSQRSETWKGQRTEKEQTSNNNLGCFLVRS